MVAAELEGDATARRLGADGGAVAVPSFEEPALAVAGDLLGAARAAGAATVEDARGRVVEEEAVVAVAAGKLEPVAPVIVQRVVAEDERAARKRGRLPSFAGGEGSRDEADAFGAGAHPAEAELFEQPVRAVQCAAGGVAGDTDLVFGGGDGEAICRERPGGEFDRGLARGPGPREVTSEFPGGEGEHRIAGVERGGGRREIGGGECHGAACYRRGAGRARRPGLRLRRASRQAGG